VAFFQSSPIRVVLLASVVFFSATIGGVLSAEAAGADPLQEAQAAFNKHQYDRALQLLEPLARSGNVSSDVRRLKARTLAKLGRGVEALVEYEGVVQRSKQDAPALLREVAFGFIIPLLKDMRVQMRGAGYTALKEVESEETVPYFEEGLSDDAGQVRALAAESLGQFEAGRRSPRLKSALQDQAAYVRKYAVRALGKTGDRTMVGLIEKYLEDEEPIVRVSAAGALAMLDQPLGWERLSGSAKSRNPDERSAALLILGTLKRRTSFPEFEAASGDEQPSVRAAAVAGLGDLGDRKAAPILLKALHDPIPGVRGAAGISLGKLRYTDASNDVKNMLSDKNPGVRADAVAVLLEFRVPYGTVVGTVRELAGDKEPSVRARVARSLSKGQGESVKDAVEGLRLLLQDVLPLPRMAAARALGHIKSAQVMTILKETLHDQDEAVRATAAGALIRVLDGKPSSTRD